MQRRSGLNRATCRCRIGRRSHRADHRRRTRPVMSPALHAPRRSSSAKSSSGGDVSGQMRRRGGEMALAASNARKMALAGEKRVLHVFMRARRVEDRLPQKVDAFPGLRRQPDLAAAPMLVARAGLDPARSILLRTTILGSVAGKPRDDRRVARHAAAARASVTIKREIGAIDRRPGRARCRSCSTASLVSRRSRGIDDVQRNALDLDAASHRVARRSGQRRSRSRCPRRRAG